MSCTICLTVLGGSGWEVGVAALAEAYWLLPLEVPLMAGVTAVKLSISSRSATVSAGEAIQAVVHARRAWLCCLA